MATKYISIPVEVEAIKFDITTLSEIIIFSECLNFQLSKKGNLYNCLISLGGGVKLLVIEGDYVVKDADRNISVVISEIFESSYIKKE